MLARTDKDIMSAADRTSHGAVQAELNAQLAKSNMTVSEGHTGPQRMQQAWYLAAAALPCVHTICEIGLNAGHSATVWLSAKPHIRLFSFDLGNKPYTFEAVKYLIGKFPGRLTLTFGNSMDTVPMLTPQLRGSCDIVVVDGGHTEDLAWHDIQNMRKLANSDSILIIDDVNCNANYCEGPSAAVARAVKEGVLEVFLNRSATSGGSSLAGADKAGAERGFLLGRYRSKQSTSVEP